MHSLGKYLNKQMKGDSDVLNCFDNLAETFETLDLHTKLSQKQIFEFEPFQLKFLFNPSMPISSIKLVPDLRLRVARKLVQSSKYQFL